VALQPVASATLTFGANVQRQQTASAVLMVRPASFGFNAMTAASNAMQTDLGSPGVSTSETARAEFDALANALRGEGIGVCVVDDSAPPALPDAVFPNNWLSFHDDGTIVMYPLLATNRRLERRAAIVTAACRELEFTERRRLDLSHHESTGRFLEGTGSLVLDHVERVAYACRSPRTDESLVQEWAQQLGYEARVFSAADERGQAFYHTNVMLWIGSRCACVCAESIDGAERATVLRKLALSGRTVIEISQPAVQRFAGNMLELASWDEALGDTSVLLMSQSARGALSNEQWQQLSASVDSVLCVPVPTIETVGGGSVRCMMAEVPSVMASGAGGSG
jgi:hypothetical protein